MNNKKKQVLAAFGILQMSQKTLQRSTAEIRGITQRRAQVVLWNFSWKKKFTEDI